MPKALDRSLPVAGYVQHGMPAPDATWQPRHYRAAIQALQRTTRDDPSKLPRHGSPHSGAIFDRLVAPDNFNTLTDGSGTARDRSRAAMDFWEVVPQILQLYGRQTETGGFPDEQIILAKLLLQLIAPTFGVLPESQHERFAELSAALASGALAMLSESERYSSRQRRELAASLVAQLPAYFDRLPDSLRRSLVTKLESAGESDATPDADLSDLLTQLESRLAAPLAPNPSAPTPTGSGPEQ